MCLCVSEAEEAAASVTPTVASTDSQLLVSDPDRRKFLEFPLKFTFKLI